LAYFFAMSFRPSLTASITTCGRSDLDIVMRLRHDAVDAARRKRRGLLVRCIPREEMPGHGARATPEEKKNRVNRARLERHVSGLRVIGMKPPWRETS